jgi:DMSO/TMAO reductase YedYZ molybdopterin-dependent catalytic subunit
MSNRELPPRSVEPHQLRKESRRSFLIFGAGALATAAGFLYVMPTRIKQRILGKASWLDSLEARRQKLMGGVLSFDDDVAEALYSTTRRVRTYQRSDASPIRNNYNGRTPGPGYLASWRLTLTGLQSGNEVTLGIDDLMRGFLHQEQVTRLVCVEGWSAVAWWSGFRFADLLRAYPPTMGSRWAAIESAVNLDGAGNPDPYYVSIDLGTAR